MSLRFPCASSPSPQPFVLSLAAALVLAACGDDPTVSGRVTRDGEGIAGAAVSIGDESTTTDADGSYVLTGIASGPQTLVARAGDTEAAFEQTSVELDVSSDTEADVLLPEPVTLSLATATSSTLALTWTPSTDSGFREYRLVYGLDAEVTPLHVSTSADDNSFTDGLGETPLSSNFEHTYRVFTLDDHGGLAGSNVLHARTLEWDATDFSELYQLVEGTSFAGAGSIRGLDWDGSAFWLVYRRAIGGYYDNDEYRLVRFDPGTGDELTSFTYTDEYAPPAGLAWDGEKIWINFEATDRNVVKRFDPVTGAVDKTLSHPVGAVDIAWDGSHLLIANTWTEVEVVDPQTGALVATLPTPHSFSTQRGLTVHNGHIWAASWVNDDLAIIDATGKHIGVARTPYASADWNYDTPAFLAFAGEQLALVFDDRIHLLDLVPVDAL